MSQIEQIETSRDKPGNTGKQACQSCYYCFTLNNYTESEIEQIEQILSFESDWYVFQEEKGENNTPHIQGTLKLKKKQRITQLKKWNQRIHWEVTRSISASIAYASKEKTRCGRQFSKGIEIPKPLKILKEEDLYIWQKKIIALIDTEPDDRTIHWVWEMNGCTGKTQLIKYLLTTRNDVIAVSSGKGPDLAYAVSCAKNFNTVLIFLPRSLENMVNYMMIESIKDGLVFSGKYESKTLIFNSPHVIVFANFEPFILALSLDRWQIYNIENNDLINRN